MSGVLASIKSRFFFDRYSLVQFFRQMATLVKAGFGSLRGIEVCSAQTSEPRLRKTLDIVRDDINAGKSYSEAVAKSKDIFTPFHVAMLRAAEAGGKLPEILDSLAEFEEKEMNLRFRLRSATSYPIFVFCFSVLCIFLLMRFLTPLLETLTNVLHGDIPFPTLVLMKFSAAASHPLFYVAIVLFGLSFSLLFRYYISMPVGKLNYDRLKFRIPLFGRLYKQVMLIRVCRIMKTLLDSGIPIASTIELLGEVADNFYFRERIMSGVAYNINEGSSIASAFGSADFFPPMMVSMIAVGEESGTLPAILGNLAAMYDFDVDIAITKFYAALEPILILVMGLITFFILMAAFLPIYQVIGMMAK
ncbi:MAG: type II secretion system F family protein [Firmicutes bacterium]|nr:type II secretion system F family protein [Bacillota bacterium]